MFCTSANNFWAISRWILPPQWSVRFRWILKRNIWTSSVPPIWYSANFGASECFADFEGRCSMIVSSRGGFGRFKAGLFCNFIFANMTSNKKYVKSTLSVVCHIFFCLRFLVVKLIQSYKVTSWGVNIFRDSRLCWSSFVICWKELTWTSIPKSKSLPDRLENNNDDDDEEVIGEEKTVSRKWIYMESF